MAEEYRYKRVLLKLSGEALAGDLCAASIRRWSIPWPTRSPTWCMMASSFAPSVGGGNIFRGVSGATDGMDRAQAGLHRHAGPRS